MSVEANSKARKEELKADAERLGISYEELKKQKKDAKDARKRHKASREAELLRKDAENGFHAQERTRMRSWSHEYEPSESKRKGERGEDVQAKRIRTRSMDAAEEKGKVAELGPATPEEWRKENNITVGKRSDRSYVPPAPFYKFSDAPFSAGIQRALTHAGFEMPTSIQAQVSMSIVVKLIGRPHVPLPLSASDINPRRGCAW